MLCGAPHNRSNDTDKLFYNHADPHPDTLGLKVLRELREVDNWNVILDREESLVPIPEQRKLGEYSSMAEADIRIAFPDLEHRGSRLSTKAAGARAIADCYGLSIKYGGESDLRLLT